MNPAELFAELFARLSADQSSPLLLEFDEMEGWPAGAFEAFRDVGLIATASPGRVVTCDGCEAACRMPVEVLPGDPPRAFVVCDKRDDVARVLVRPERLHRWQLSDGALVRLLAAAVEDLPITPAEIRAGLGSLPLERVVMLVDGRVSVDGARLAAWLLRDQDRPLGNRFLCTGNHWSVTFDGETRSIKNTMGMRYIARLIARRGLEVSVADLYGDVNPREAGSTNALLSTMSAAELEGLGLSVEGLGDAGEMLTPEARRSLEQRCLKLRDRIEDAQELGDVERQVELEDELEKVLSYLGAATGLRGRSRRASSATERIRKAVTKRIREQMQELTRTFPALGRHLLQSVKTGSICAYRPDPKVDWVVEPRP